MLSDDFDPIEGGGQSRSFEASVDPFQVFDGKGHLTENVMLVRAKAARRLSASQEGAIHHHVMNCDPCRTRWNEYYEEWCS